MEGILSLRCSGQYHKALEQLNAEQAKVHVGSDRHYLEKAICYVLQHRFDDLLCVIREYSLRPIVTDSKEDCLIRLVYDYGQIHTNLALEAAVHSASMIEEKWLKNHDLEEFDEIDVDIACFHHMILIVGSQYLTYDLETSEEPSSRTRMEKLRTILIAQGRLNELSMVHLAESKIWPGNKLSSLCNSIEKTRDCGRNDLLVHLTVLHSEALHDSGHLESAANVLRLLEMENLNHNPERALWVQLKIFRIQDELNPGEPEIGERLLEDFKVIRDMKGAQECAFVIAKVYITKENENLYLSAIRKLLAISQAVSLTVWLGDSVNDGNTRASGADLCGSNLEFWEQYLSFVNADISDRHRLGLVLHCCQSFFAHHATCSIPHLKYILACILAGCFESLGDTHSCLQWLVHARDFAAETGQETIMSEAESQLEIALRTFNIRVMDDTYGVKQRQWAMATEMDLEILFENAKEKRQFSNQSDYALLLLQKELNNEIKANTPPVSRMWLAKSLDSLNSLPDEERDKKKLAIDFSLAHSIFEFEDYDQAIISLGKILETSITNGNDEITARVSFALARAYLHLYLRVHAEDTWNAFWTKLGDCQSICQKLHQTDVLACCHVLSATLLNARPSRSASDLTVALNHITEAQRIWKEERATLSDLPGLNGLLSKYSLRQRNESNQYSILGLAIEMCYNNNDFKGAWSWLQQAKAQVFAEQLRELNVVTEQPVVDNCIPSNDQKLPVIRDGVVFVHWITIGNVIYMLTTRVGEKHQMFRLDVDTQTVIQWHQDLEDTRDDLSDVESANDLLSELSGLCKPLENPTVSRPDELLIFCPSQILSKTPLHSIPFNGEPLLKRNPIVYTHSFDVMRKCLNRVDTETPKNGTDSITFIGNPTGDTPAGQTCAETLKALLAGQSYVRNQATKNLFLEKAPLSRLLHFHGHIQADEYPLNHSMIFHTGDTLTVRETFALNLHQRHPLVMLIGCASGRERVDSGDEPLGFVSGLIFAGACAVVSTMWPIHDGLSGAAFTESFYGYGQFETDQIRLRRGQAVDLARRVQKAAMDIRANPETSAPYFWAGYILHGNWDYMVPSIDLVGDQSRP